jgi:hypothetical protein
MTARATEVTGRGCGPGGWPQPRHFSPARVRDTRAVRDPKAEQRQENRAPPPAGRRRGREIGNRQCRAGELGAAGPAIRAAGSRRRMGYACDRAAAAGGTRGGRPVQGRRTWGGRPCLPPGLLQGRCAGRNSRNSNRRLPGTAAGGKKRGARLGMQSAVACLEQRAPRRHVTCGRSSYVPTASRRWLRTQKLTIAAASRR